MYLILNEVNQQQQKTTPNPKSRLANYRHFSLI